MWTALPAPHPSCMLCFLSCAKAIRVEPAFRQVWTRQNGNTIIGAVACAAAPCVRSHGILPLGLTAVNVCSWSFAPRSGWEMPGRPSGSAANLWTWGMRQRHASADARSRARNERLFFLGSMLIHLAKRLHASKEPCAPQHFLYFFPLPHGHGSFLPTLLEIAVLIGFNIFSKSEISSGLSGSKPIM